MYQRERRAIGISGGYRYERIDMSKEISGKLTEEDLKTIMNNCSANIFVTDGTGKIIYSNELAAIALDATVEYLLTKDVRDLVKEGLTSNSSTAKVLETKDTVISSYINRKGEELVVTSVPVFESGGEDIRYVVTNSRKKSDMDHFLRELDKERRNIAKLKDAVDFFDRAKKERNVIIYKSREMKELCDMADIVAPTDSAIMIYGESGVGKEVFANYIHNRSKRANNIFVPINCAAIPANLIESELFGYVGGSFTGASSEGKAGLFEIADKGTIFMDEIGELPLPMQAKLLRVLETGEIRRIGSDKIIKVDVRIIGATNRNLPDMIMNKEFRDDLYYRLNVLPLNIPPLRQRRDDIQELADYFLRRANKKYDRNASMSTLMMFELRNYDWPGNVRELRNIIERYVITGNENIITNLKGEYTGINESKPDTAIPVKETEEVMPLKEKMSQVEKEYIMQVMKQNGGSVQRTADMLGVHRSLIYRKLSD